VCFEGKKALVAETDEQITEERSKDTSNNRSSKTRQAVANNGASNKSTDRAGEEKQFVERHSLAERGG
jgi:hypothetical protein